LSENCNITSEAHPLTLSSEQRIAGLAEIGITRISIGCQTFDPDILVHCNRSNTPEQIEQIVRTAQKHGLAINIDMMTGLPGQTVASVRNDLEILGKIRPNAVEYIRHEIVNPLIVELYTARPDLIVADDTLFEMVFMTQEWMENLGYEQNGRFSDDKQWGYRYHWLKEMPIIAFGSRSRSYTRSICYDKHEDLSTYNRMIDKGILPIGRYIPLTKRERMYRTLMLGLQLRSGLDTGHFQEMYAERAFDVFGPLLAKLGEYGCITQAADSLRLTRYGAYFVEDVCDAVIDAALKDESVDLVRESHSGGHRYPTVTPEA
jgi:oxygen-independent coproporphyrinogen-3 oxidase